MQNLNYLWIKIAVVFVVLFVLACPLYCADTSYTIVSNKVTKAIVSYLITKDPSYASKKIQISYKYADRTFRELNARKGDIVFSVAELYPDFKPIGNIIIPIQITVDGVQKEKIFLRAKVSVFDKIVVAKKRFKRGDVILDGDAAIEERDIAVLSSDVIRDASVVIDKEVKTYVPSGNAIYVWMIRERPFVRKNERIKITANVNNISVSASGLSLEDGMFGAEVRAKNLYSGREIVGVVVATGEVAVR